MGLTTLLVTHITQFIASTGYASIGLLMMLESMIFPVPSEAVMPFVGFLINAGRFTFPGVLLWSTAGSLLGSLISYWIGAHGGKPFIHRFGKFFLLNDHHLEYTHQFFEKYGEKTIFISRFIPIVRHFISIPAGIGRMSYPKFITYTVVGAALWNGFLTYIGMALGTRWNALEPYMHQADVVMLALLVGAVGYVVLRVLTKRRKI